VNILRVLPLLKKLKTIGAVTPVFLFYAAIFMIFETAGNWLASGTSPISQIIQSNDVGLALLRQIEQIFPAGKQKKLAADGFDF
jgi:hypothetical protein